MRDLKLSDGHSARVWLGNLPDAGYPALKALKRPFHATGPSTPKPRTAAIEFNRHVGPRCMYGLLGGRLNPGPSEQIVASVNASLPEGRRFQEAIAWESETVYAGLPLEYIEGVFEGIEVGCKAISMMPAGELRIDHAAHGVVGSSHMVFKELTVILLKLISLDSDDPSDEELKALIK